jgi:DNA polymerase-3 subunit gamma/tau
MRAARSLGHAPPSARPLAMVVRVGPLATASRKPRQARKGAAVAVKPGAGMRLARAASIVASTAPRRPLGDPSGARRAMVHFGSSDRSTHPEHALSYQALARTWRPRTFDDLVGQEHVVKALVHALDDDRLHHAYLFTGTRGVGKTTIARILAKCLNCEQGVSSRPCGECSACREIDEGRFVDLLEVDAASRTKVEDTRDLLDNVQYAPTRGRYKVYLIDEVHMLSGHSFNALLKTLEEPPPHVKFLLATTDPQKLPVTVLSRCLQFNLKRLPLSLIEPRLAVVTEAEKIGAEPGALALLARAADGSMRDALSLLDQAAAYCQGELTDAEVRAMLGTIDRQHAVRLLDGLATGDAAALLAEVAELDERVPDYVAALDELAGLIQRVAIAQVAGVADDDEHGDPETLRRLAGLIPAEDLQLYYQIALIGKRDLHLAPSERAGFEMALLRMATFRPAEAAPAANDAPASGGGAAKARATAAKAAAGPSRRAGSARQSEAVSKPEAASKSEAARKSEASKPDGDLRSVAARESETNATPAEASDHEARHGARGKGPGVRPATVRSPAHDAVHGPAAAPVRGRGPGPTGVAEGAAAATAETPRTVSRGRVMAATAAATEIEMPIARPAPTAAVEYDAGADGLPSDQAGWNDLVSRLRLRGGGRQLAGSCHLDGCEGDLLRLTLDSARQHLYTETLREKLVQAIGAACGRPVRLQIEIGEPGSETLAQRRDREAAERQRAAVEQIARDPCVAALEETFGATVDPTSIRPRPSRRSSTNH